MKPVVGVAHARVGLLGNPSDGYGGKAIAFCVADFEARVYLEPAEDLRLLGDHGARRLASSLVEAGGGIDPVDPGDGSHLLEAALYRFLRAHPESRRVAPEESAPRFSMRLETNIPRQVGLGGSSAIVIAALRALGDLFGITQDPVELATSALAAEQDDLGIAAGPMDRIVQAREGAVVMDLTRPGDLSSHFAIEPNLLPPLFIAWQPARGEPSGVAHGDLQARWRAGDREVLETIGDLRALVDEGLGYLERGEHALFCRAMGRNLELRERIFSISEGDRQMVEIAARHGATAKLCGSGGAVVGATASDHGFENLEKAFVSSGYRFLRPRVKTAAPVAKAGAR